MRHNQTTSARIVLLCALALLLTACSPPAPTRRAVTRPTASQQTSQRASSQPTTYLRPGVWRVASARAILTSAFPENHIPPFDSISTNPALAQQLYDAMLALPAMPKGTYYCPIDFGALYHLRFYSDAGLLVATAIAEPGGCETVTAPDGSKRWAATDQNFWSTFAATFNTSLSAVRPMPRQSGPSAPTTLPN